MAIVRGLMIAPDMGGRLCYAVEVAFDNGDYENAIVVRVVFDECPQASVTFLEGSGVCAWHFGQLKERERREAIQ